MRNEMCAVVRGVIDVTVSADIADRMIEEILELQHPAIPLTSTCRAGTRLGASAHDNS
jgi:hypothetical protein